MREYLGLLVETIQWVMFIGSIVVAGEWYFSAIASIQWC